ncbi:MAG: hypothetical protein WD772_03230 [Pseudohongiellaceae bacterium]
MSLGRRVLQQDLFLLKWQFILMGLVLMTAIGLYAGALYYRNDMRRDEFIFRTNFDNINNELQQIEEERAVILQYIDAFNIMAQRGVLEEENRVGLLEDIRLLRNRHRLFPIEVQIREQERILLQYPLEVENVDELISLRASRVQLRIPLLHEADLSRFLSDFIQTGRLLVVERCLLEQAYTKDEDFYEMTEHGIATCDIYWYTLRREQPVIEEEFQ